MCIAVPGRILSIVSGVATIDYGSEQRAASIVSNDFAVGDYVITMGKVVVQKVPEQQAKEALRLYAEAVAKG